MIKRVEESDFDTNVIAKKLQVYFQNALGRSNRVGVSFLRNLSGVSPEDPFSYQNIKLFNVDLAQANKTHMTQLNQLASGLKEFEEDHSSLTIRSSYDTGTFSTNLTLQRLDDLLNKNLRQGHSR